MPNAAGWPSPWPRPRGAGRPPERRLDARLGHHRRLRPLRLDPREVRLGSAPQDRRRSGEDDPRAGRFGGAGGGAGEEPARPAPGDAQGGGPGARGDPRPDGEGRRVAARRARGQGSGGGRAGRRPRPRADAAREGAGPRRHPYPGGRHRGRGRLPHREVVPHRGGAAEARRRLHPGAARARKEGRA